MLTQEQAVEIRVTCRRGGSVRGIHPRSQGARSLGRLARPAATLAPPTPWAAMSKPVGPTGKGASLAPAMD